ELDLKAKGCPITHASRPYLQNVHGAACGQRLLFTTAANRPEALFVGDAAKLR
ncbi:MAG: hypothetical protein ACI9AQ_001956, partial [Dinoroseobacter sp.]